MFGRGKEEWFRTVPDLPHGIPSQDTLGDVFSRLDPGSSWSVSLSMIYDSVSS